ncbi:MAG: hypothetical protein AAF206_29990, partial [Bacteroidota bacterium]
MKNFLKVFMCSFALVSLLFIQQASAQSPEAFKYQAVLRDASYAPLTDQYVSIRISILEGSAVGPVVYQEFHTPTTSSIGLVSLNIGEGNVLSGVFGAIEWDDFHHYLQVEVDQAGGTSYEPLGVSQLLSVPYALFAKKAGTVHVEAGDGIDITGATISNSKPSLWQLDSNIVFVDTNQVGIGLTDSTVFPDEALLFVNGNVQIADDSSLLGVGQIKGASGISFAANPTRSDDMVLQN